MTVTLISGIWRRVDSWKFARPSHVCTISRLRSNGSTTFTRQDGVAIQQEIFYSVGYWSQDRITAQSAIVRQHTPSSVTILWFFGSVWTYRSSSRRSSNRQMQIELADRAELEEPSSILTSCYSRELNLRHLHFKNYVSCLRRTVSHWLLRAEDPFRSKTIPCRICDVQSSGRKEFLAE